MAATTATAHDPPHATAPLHRVAPLEVLTEPVLWRTITSSVAGWPFPLYRFWKDRVTTYTLHSTYRDWVPSEFPQRRGAVPHVAIVENNLAMLQLVYAQYQLIKTTEGELSTVADSLLDMRSAMLCAAHCGRLEILDWLLETHAKDGAAAPWASESNAMASAFDQRNFQVMDVLYERWPRAQTAIPYCTIKKAVWKDDVELVKWAYDRGYDMSEQGNWRMKHVMDHAASLAMLEVLHSGPRTDVHCSWRAMDKAGSLGDLGMMQFLHAHQLGGYDYRAVDYAARHGRLDILRFFLEDVGLQWESIGFMDVAATHGHLDIIAYLHARGIDGWTAAAMDGAATNGHLQVVRFLHEHRTEGCTTAAIDGAATNGHLQVVQFLHEHRTEGCTKSAMDQAVANGHLAVVQFLHEHRTEGCTTAAAHAAIMNGHVDVARFLLKHRSEGGRPLTVDTAARHGWCDIVELLLAGHRGKKGGCTKAAMDNAARSGHVDVVALLHERSTVGCTVKAMDGAAAHGHLAVVKFLHDHRTEGCSFRALTSAAANNHLDVVQFLLAHRTEGCVPDALEAATAAGHHDVAACLQSALPASDGNNTDDGNDSDSDNGSALSAFWQ